VTVQTAKVAEGGLACSQVTASGEVKPTTYTNITRRGFGRITEILVKRATASRRRRLLLAGESCNPTPMCELSSLAMIQRVWSTDLAEPAIRRPKPI